ncbi:hypothetical protein R3P38DRAFT_3169788 [Favolaschia claudopus]|uniref:Uncharacterized protein n=1 Tax=Favolaschia claudopus TaxID=2862362 RepID=A0AAW0DUU9_9AGAR
MDMSRYYATPTFSIAASLVLSLALLAAYGRKPNPFSYSVSTSFHTTTDMPWKFIYTSPIALTSPSNPKRRRYAALSRAQARLQAELDFRQIRKHEMSLLSLTYAQLSDNKGHLTGRAFCPWRGAHTTAVERRNRVQDTACPEPTTRQQQIISCCQHPLLPALSTRILPPHRPPYLDPEAYNSSLSYLSNVSLGSIASESSASFRCRKPKRNTRLPAPQVVPHRVLEHGRSSNTVSAVSNFGVHRLPRTSITEKSLRNNNRILNAGDVAFT